MAGPVDAFLKEIAENEKLTQGGKGGGGAKSNRGRGSDTLKIKKKVIKKKDKKAEYKPVPKKKVVGKKL